MSEPTRREFLAAAGGALASSAVSAREPLAAEPRRRRGRPPAIPPHRPQVVEGIHAYADRVSVAAGDVIRFHVSSSYPYELQVCRLGPDVDGPGRDEVVQSFGPSPAAVQPIHPGSYLFVEKPLDPQAALPALTLEVWVRRWRTIGRQAILSQFDEPDACGFGLFVNEDGSLSFYLGDGGPFDRAEPPHDAPRPAPDGGQSGGPEALPGQHAQLGRVRTDGITSSRDSTATSKQVWVDGREVAAWEHPARPARRGPLADRSGGAQGRRHRRSSTPTSPCRRSTAGPCPPRRSRPGSPRRPSRAPPTPTLLACWPLDEERGDRAADASPHGRHARIINRGTWMIGGPSFDADVPRFGTYDPSNDPRAATACGWRPTTSSIADGSRRTNSASPRTPAPGLYVGRFRFRLDGEERLYHTRLHRQEGAGTAQGADRVPLLDQHLAGLLGHAVQPDLEGAQEVDRQQRLRQQPGRAARLLLLPAASRRAREPIRSGFRMPWPVVGPYTLMGPEEWDYSHLCRQDRFTQAWLETQGYDYDVVQRHRPPPRPARPRRLPGAVRRRPQRILVVRGDGRRSAGSSTGAGSAVVLSGNTAFWRVSFNDDASVMECRKADAPGTQVRADRRGEMWHSHDGRRGGMSRECGFPAWRLFGLEYFSLDGRGHAGGRAVHGPQSRPLPLPPARST